MEGIRPLGFLDYARDFIRARRQTFPRAIRRSRSPVPYFLACRSIELSLKAFLLSRGESPDLLARAIGHSLKLAYERAREKGLQDYVSVDTREELALYRSSKYYATKQAEYFYFPEPIESAWRKPPDLAALTTLANKLLKGARPACMEYYEKTRTKWTRGSG